MIVIDLQRSSKIYFSLRNTDLESPLTHFTENRKVRYLKRNSLQQMRSLRLKTLGQRMKRNQLLANPILL